LLEKSSDIVQQTPVTKKDRLYKRSFLVTGVCWTMSELFSNKIPMLTNAKLLRNFATARGQKFSSP